VWCAGILILFQAISSGAAAGFNVASVLFMLFGSVVLHELGHALMGQVFGIRTREIVLTPIGGIAMLDSALDNSRAEIWIAIAGPVVNFVLVALAMPLLLVSNASWISYFIMVNIMLGTFNLIPAFPMDGGRILRALLAKKYGYQKATLKALKISRIFGVLFIVVGIFYSIMLSIIGIFLLLTSSRHERLIKRGYL
jgi:Zn-dependent protease